MEKKWGIKEKFPDDFKIKNKNYHDIIWQLLWSRGIKEPEDQERFFKPDLERDLIDPFCFSQMEKAVEIIISHIKNQNKITIYGDYDADGVTSSALMMEILQILRAEVDIYIPHRVTEGYGLNMLAVGKIAESGTKLIITVDNGMRGKEEVERAKELGMEVIITDHHPAPASKEEWPDCPVIDPVIPGEDYPDKTLAGVGVAFKLAAAIIRRSKLSEHDKKKLETRLLDLVAIGTVADCVSLLGENRVLVKFGLETLNNTKRLGLKELISAAGLNKNRILDTWNIGFQIAPRLNAAGRMGRANTAYELLAARNAEEAKILANRLNQRNIERQQITEDIFSEVEKQIDSSGKDKIIIGICPDNKSNNKDNWNEGVVGLVAGRIASKYNLPTLVITKAETGFKGSGRSVADFNLIAAVEKCADLLTKYGGHPAACGFSLDAKNLEEFKNKITSISNKVLGGIDLSPRVEIEAELALGDLNDCLAEQINNFAPFGQNNSRPHFVSEQVSIMDIMHMGMEGQHLKLRVKDENSAVFTALGFGQAEKWAHLTVGDVIKIVYYLEFNEFNGKRELQLKIIDIKN